MGKEIFIRTVSGVLTLILFFLVLNFILHRFFPCGCNKPAPGKDLGTGTPVNGAADKKDAALWDFTGITM